MIQVGRTNPKSKLAFTYKECISDWEGWVNANEFLPISFDLMHLKTDEGRRLTGWWSGSEWDGLKYEDQKITHWKRKPDVET